MAFGLWDFLLASLMFVNAVAILNEERFLARLGWGKHQSEQAGYGMHPQQATVKQQIIHLMSAVRTLLRIPLIIINLVTAALLLIFG